MNDYTGYAEKPFFPIWYVCLTCGVRNQKKTSEEWVEIEDKP